MIPLMLLWLFGILEEIYCTKIYGRCSQSQPKAKPIIDRTSRSRPERGGGLKLVLRHIPNLVHVLLITNLSGAKLSQEQG